MSDQIALNNFATLIRAMYDHPSLRNDYVTSTVVQQGRVVLITQDLRDITMAIGRLAEDFGFEVQHSINVKGGVHRLIISQAY